MKRRVPNGYSDIGPSTKRSNVYTQESPTNITNNASRLINRSPASNGQQMNYVYRSQPNQIHSTQLQNHSRSTLTNVNTHANGNNVNRSSPNYLRTPYLPAYTVSAASATSEASYSRGLVFETTNYACQLNNIPICDYNNSTRTTPSPLQLSSAVSLVGHTKKSNGRSPANSRRGAKAKGNRHAPVTWKNISATVLSGFNKPPIESPDPREIIEAFHNDEVTITPVKNNQISSVAPLNNQATNQPAWNKDDALKAYKLQKEIIDAKTGETLLLKFPDPELNKNIVRSFAPQFIEQVHFQKPSTRRYCFVQLQKDANVEEAIQILSQIDFGNGKITAEIKRSNCLITTQVTPETIDPYTLYVGNLPPTKIQKLKSLFPTHTRVRVGISKRIHSTRYAFIEYDNVEKSMAAFRKSHNLQLDTIQLNVRFRRINQNRAADRDETDMNDIDNDPPLSDGNNSPIYSLENESDTNSRSSQLSQISAGLETKENVLAEARRLMSISSTLPTDSINSSSKEFQSQSQSTIATTTISNATTSTPTSTTASTTTSTTSTTTSTSTNTTTSKAMSTTLSSISSSISSNASSLTTLTSNTNPDESLNDFSLLGTKLKQEVLDPEFNTNHNDDDDYSANPVTDDDSDYEERYRNHQLNDFHSDSDSDNYDRSTMALSTMPLTIKEENDDEELPISKGKTSKYVDFKTVENCKNVEVKTNEEAEIDRLFDALNSDDEI